MINNTIKDEKHYCHYYRLRRFNLTERAVMREIHTLSSEKTIILIAHSLSTVRNCDTIFLLEQGELIAQGTYEELHTNKSFKKMAEANE
jgi:ATP-binding cassette, subfamily B, bacterial PglK